ncbi:MULTISPECIES: tripartite tricarboxylate transporter substrate binding protein [unclassified Beijerinckia]|uniref:Bug family tripartite tricarboxylate transporter substrate binding protein n=1 Tax=unclassified Beijerinckia TaxID=2638183 RepID=UPI00089A344D|nr:MULTISPECIES: tripartite tricarboxylate transporter substrate binding protein [unclassified Beijerinckia]MDH7798799.1 tripartite-type tricarboxylate transporter receptor subunit TctC [Beijerinckia sp. GAS462]SED33629.1 Tripartite-type tricarboxylate transporter, receptor component TctC [Beijerinckia sp. 28-YEA-48]
MLKHTRIASIAATFALALTATTSASAQQLKFIVGTAAGGAIDAYVRVIAEHMAKTLGKTYIVESRTGNSSNLAAQYVVNAPADGTTIMIGTQALMEINPHVFDHPRWAQSDYLPLIKGVEAPLVFVTHPSVPAKSFQEFLDWAKSKSGSLSYASYSPGTPSHFLGAQLNERFNLNLAHVPYRGSAPQTIDILAGHALFGFTQTQSAVPNVETGKMKALAVTGEKRFPQLPDTPTFAELGYPEFNTSIWFGLLIRKDTPPALAEPLLQAAIAAHADPDIRKLLEAQGFVVSGQTTETFAKAIAQGSERWAKLVRSTGFKAGD